MFLRKLIVIACPLLLLILICLLIPFFSGSDFFGSVLLGCLLGVSLGLLLPLSGATRMREPFAHLLWIPAVVLLLVLIWQYLRISGISVPVLNLLGSNDARVFTVESTFMAYMITFSVRTGRGI